MIRSLKTPSDDLLRRIFDTLDGDRTPPTGADVAERARIRRERLRRMLVRGLFAGSIMR